jgi:hypothetical protein
LTKEEVMRKALLPLFLFVSLGAPTAALANGDDGGTNHQTSARSVAVQQCKRERAQVGRLAFQQKYGTPHAFKNCVRANGGSSNTEGTNDDQNAVHKGHRKHKKGDQNGDQKGSRKHHKTEQTGDDNGHTTGDN